MDFSVAKEVYVFLSMFACGISICIIYDILRLVRSYGKATHTLTAVEDIIFWCIAIIIMFFTVLYTNFGYVRWYEFLGVFLGGLIYFLLLSKVFCLFLKKIIEIFLKILTFFCKILLTPLVFTYNIIYKSILFIFVPIFKFFRWLFLKIKTEFKNMKSVLFRK